MADSNQQEIMDPISNEIAAIGGPGSSSSFDRVPKKNVKWKPVEHVITLFNCVSGQNGNKWNPLEGRSDGERKSSTTSEKGKQKKITAYELFSIDQANSTTETGASKFNTIMEPKENVLKEDGAIGDDMDAVSLDEEGTALSNEGYEDRCNSCGNPLGGRSDGKRNSSSTSKKGKQKKIATRESLFSVDRANSTTETGASKLNTIMEPKENVLEEDSAVEDDMDGEGTALSNEGYEDMCNSCGNPLGGRSDGKKKSSSTSKKGKQKKIVACESLFPVDRANSTTETGVSKLNTIMEPKENVLEEDRAIEDDMDAVYLDEEGAPLSDEGYEDRCNSCGNPLGGHSDEKRKSSTTSKKGKQKKIAARESLFSVDRVNSTTETGASKLNTIMEPKENVLEEDSVVEDDMDVVYLDGEGTALSDEGYEDRCNSCGNPLGGRSDGKRKSSSTSKKEKQKKIAVRESFSVDRANSTTETGASKLNTIMEPKENVLEDDGTIEDDMDAVYLDEEGTTLSDEGYEDRCNSCGNPLGGRSDGKRKSSSTSKKGKQKKIATHESLFSVGRANSTTETGTSKLNTIMEPKENVLEEDRAIEDDMDAVYLDEEGAALSDEGYEDRCNSCGNPLGGRSDEKRKLSSTSKKGKQKKIADRELSFSVDRANSVAEAVIEKINTIRAPKENAGVECVEELLATGRLQRQTPLYFFACTLLAQKQYWDMLAVMSDADEKFEWIQWQFNERIK